MRGARPVDAVVTGFTRNAELSRQALAPLLTVRREGGIRHIHYVTWLDDTIDAYVAPIAALEDVLVRRVPKPPAYGNANQKGVTYQVRNLEIALGLVPEDDTVVLKLRPDFVIDTDFLRTKIATFERWSAIDPEALAFGIKLPLPPLSRKVWVPWADANQPFFFEDAAFIGLKCDLKGLVTPNLENRLGILDDPGYGPFAHVVRWGSLFADRYPMIRRYLAEYGGFFNDVDYRKTLVPVVLNDPFFWHLIVLNAFILWTGFHIDCGKKGELVLIANNTNRESDWSRLTALKLAPPYDDVARWRAAQRVAMGLLPAVDCVYGRLTDDGWPRAMFTRVHEDVKPATLAQIALVLSRYEQGALEAAENAFYEKLAAHHRNWIAQPAA